MVKKIKTIIKTDYGDYVAVFEPEPDMGGYMVTVLKRSDVITWGKNMAHAKRMAKEAIECSIEGDIIIAMEKKGVITVNKQRLTA